MESNLKLAFIIYGVATLIFSLLVIYIGKRFLSGTGLGGTMKAGVIAFLALVVILLPLPAFFRVGDLKPPWGEQWFILVFLLMAFMSFVLVLTLIKDVAFLLIGLATKVKSLFLIEAGEVNLARRSFLHQIFSYGVVVFSSVLFGYGLYQARKNIQIKPIKIPSGKLHNQLKDLNIIQITDVHIGLTIKKDFIQELVDRINALKPDLLFFTGDAVDGSVKELREHFAPFSQLTTTIGKYFVTGNHEYYSGALDWIEEITRNGFKVLTNENEIVTYNGKKLLIAGVPDVTASQFIPSQVSDPAKAKITTKSYDYSILLAHQPLSIKEAAKAEYDLQLSGHTHGGQFFPWNFFVKLQQPYVSGLHKHKKTWIYVSKGTGYWGPPIRVGAQAEITQIQIL